MIAGAAVGAALTATACWCLNALPHPAFKGWGFVGPVAFGALCGALAGGSVQ